MQIIKITNKRLYLFISVLLFLFLYFGKANLIFGKTIAYQNSAYTNKKIPEKQNTSSTPIKNNKDHHHSLLGASGSDNLSIWSNSFNFAKSGNSKVDPRTGILLVSMKVGLLQSNLGHGPDIDLEINYNSSAKGDPDHLGRGWAWNLTHYNPATHQLDTSGGKSFFLEQQPDGNWHPLYHKLKDVIITNDKKGGLVIKSTNGIQDILDRDGYEIRMEQQNGEGVNFNYMPGSHLLKKMTDDNGHSIWLTRKDNYLTVTSYDVQGNQVNMRISLENNEVRNIWFPGSNHQQTANNSRLIHLSYETHNRGQDLLTGIHYFTGMEKQFTYDCYHAMKLPDIRNLNPSQPLTSVCVVKQISTIPGANQPQMNVNYSYTGANSNSHDYLGFNAGLTAISGSNRDILFEAPSGYTYQTKEDNGQVHIIRTYDKYHLLIDTTTVSDKTNKRLNKTEVYFCRTDKRDGCANTTFSQLPDTYSLPLKIVTKSWGDNLFAPAKTVINRSYDDYGRLTSQTDGYGRKTETTYCPQHGDNHCPAAPADWPVASLTERTKIFPAPVKNSTLLSPVTTQMDYQKTDNRNKPGYTLVLYKTTVKSGNAQRTETRQYYQDKHNPLTYGLLKRKKLTGTDLPAESVKEIIHHYQYTLNKQGIETLSAYTDVANNHAVVSSLTEKSLFVPKTLRVISADKKNIQTFEYDKLGRITAHTNAAGTPFTATIRNQYRLSANENNITVTAPNGMQKKVIFDGAGRKLATYIEKTDLQGHFQPGVWQQQTQISYNAKGEVTASTRYTDNGQNSGVAVALTTRFDYDLLGRLIRKHLPDGETEVTHYDNAHRCVVHYSEDAQNNRTAVTIGLSSVTGKPLEQIILPAATGILPSMEMLCTRGDKQPGAKVSRMIYDGFDRLISTEDPMGKVVQKQYDALGHVTDIIDPVGDKQHNVYDLTGHVIQHWVIPAQGGQYLLASAGFNAAGQKLWAAGEDGKRTTYYYNINGQLTTVNKSNGHTIALSYNSIGLPVADSLDGKVFLQVSYDHKTHKPLTVSDNTGVTTYRYRDDGLLESTTHKGMNGYPDTIYTLTYNSYHHLLSRTDSKQNKVTYAFDKLARPAEKSYQKYSGDTVKIEQLTYDPFSRVVKEVYGSGMVRLLSYDPWGQAAMIKDSINGKSLHSESFIYDADGNITRLQRSDDKHQAIISYRYDRMDNLISMHCRGKKTLCPHDTTFNSDKLKTAPVIIQQNYKFTRLNRIAGVTEKLIDTSSDQWHSLRKVMSYTYSNTKVPLRLTTIRIQWNDQQPDIHTFGYDTTGNMTIDGTGNKISYNPFNQITQVINTTGIVSHYDYNGQGKEVKVAGKNGIRQMIYQGGSLKGEIVTDTANNIHRINYPSAEIKTTDSTITDWNESNYKGDVISILKQDKASNQWVVQQHNIYSPYGMVWSYGKQNTTVPAFQQILKGFNGEITDTATGWQFLGDGHRTYNPSQRYFVSEDPAGDGYAFGSNNPIMNSDPSGNMPKWLGKAFSLANTVFSLGMSISHNKFCRGIGRSLMWGAMAIPLGPTLIGLSFSVPAALSFASTVKPANKGLQQASMMTGRVYAGALFVVGIATIAAGIGAAAGLIGAAEVGGVLAEGTVAGGEAAVEAEAEELLDVASTTASTETQSSAMTSTLADTVASSETASFMTNSQELEQSLDESEMNALNNDVDAFSDGSESDELEVPISNNVAIENIGKVQKAVFGCNQPDICNHEEVGVTVFPEDILDIPEKHAVEQIGANAYDAILQESLGKDFLRVAHAALKPGGKLYIVQDNVGSREMIGWLEQYEARARNLFSSYNYVLVNNKENFGFNTQNDAGFARVFTK